MPLETAVLVPMPRPASVRPVPVRPAAVLPVSAHRQARLARALAQIQGALAEQRLAIAAWRQSLDELRHSLSNIQESTMHFQHGLDDLRVKVAAINHQSIRLASLAEAVGG